MQNVSMWCSICEEYTKEYTLTGMCCTCNTEVVSGLHCGIDVDLVGRIETKKSGAFELI